MMSLKRHSAPAPVALGRQTTTGNLRAVEEGTSVDRIFAAAETEFAASGLDSVNVQQIADRAGVSLKLIYHYFTRKEILYSEVLVRMSNEFFAHYGRTAVELQDPIEVIRDFAFRYADFCLSHPHTARLILDQVLHSGRQITRNYRAERLRDELLNPLRAAVTNGVGMGLIRKNISAEGLFFHTLVVTVGYLTISSLLDPFHLTVSELTGEVDLRATIADFVVGAVCEVPSGGRCSRLGHLTAQDAPGPSQASATAMNQKSGGL